MSYDERWKTTKNIVLLLHLLFTHRPIPVQLHERVRTCTKILNTNVDPVAVFPANDCNHIHIVFIPKVLQLMVSVVAMNEIEIIETKTYEK